MMGKTEVLLNSHLMAVSCIKRLDCEVKTLRKTFNNSKNPIRMTP